MAPAFLVGHATHPDWRAALALAAAQVERDAAALQASGAPPLALGFVYFSDHYAADAEALLAALRQRWPRLAWVGSVGVGVAAGGTEYIDEPALALMLAPLAAGRFEVFSGAKKLRAIEPHTALVHADPGTPDVAELIAEMSDRTASSYVFGGLASSRGRRVMIADGVWQGGLSGVAFSREVALVSRVTQGCQPVGAARRITACDGHLVLELDGRPALPALLADLEIERAPDLRAALPRLRGTLAGLTDAGVSPLARGGQFGTDTRVRHLIGLEPARQAVALAERVQLGMSLAFCQRDAAAARRDLVRICSELRDEIESMPTPAWQDAGAGPAVPAAPPPGREGASRMLGALYISCAGRGGPHFGGPSAELQIVRHALGEVPLVGFFASGEIAHHHLYGYTGVLTVFTDHGAARSKQS
jgi:small ligand-binding sensory domain FIST